MIIISLEGKARKNIATLMGSEDLQLTMFNGKQKKPNKAENATFSDYRKY